MLPTTMIFTHLPHVMSIMTVQDLDLTSVETLKQSVGAFIDQKKKDNKMVSPLPPLPLLDIVFVEEGNIENLEKQIPPADQIHLPDIVVNAIFPWATTTINYIVPGAFKDSFLLQLQTSAFTVNLYKLTIYNKNYLSDSDKQEVNNCDSCDTLVKSKEYYKRKWLERVEKLYDEFQKVLIPVYEQWEGFARDLSNWVKGIKEVEKIAFKELRLELILKVFKKREDFLAYSYQALVDFIDERLKTLTKSKL